MSRGDDTRRRESDDPRESVEGERSREKPSQRDVDRGADRLSGGWAHGGDKGPDFKKAYESEEKDVDEDS